MFRTPVFRAAALTMLLLRLQGLADWRDDGGLGQLSAELGPALPTGAGISVLQTEAGNGIPQASATSPFAGTGNYFGKMFTMHSSGMVYSGHANEVANYFYGNSTSASPGVTDVQLMDAEGFIATYETNGTPPVAAGIIHNHSWIGSSGNPSYSDAYYLRAFDFQIDRDGVVSCTPLNNGTGAVPPLMACSYHSISAGLRDGNHSLGGTTEDGTGRMKPDLVVNVGFTSFASPAVASVAALLREKIKADFPAADHPQTIKAIMLAGASKEHLPAWHRAALAQPYDSTFGAGELQARQSYHILAAGSQPADNAAEVSATGWDCNLAQSSGARRYFFSIPAGQYGNLFSVALTWHRTLTHSPGAYASSLPNLDLKLHAANGLSVSTLLDQSSSTIDNVEHLFLRNLPAGEYAIDVTSDTDAVRYGLAWQTQLGAGPALAIRINSGSVFLDLANLDPFATYTVEKSSALSGWSDVASVRTADTTPATTFTWQDPVPPSSGAAFYRLRWTPIR